MEQANYLFGIIDFDGYQDFDLLEDENLGKVYTIPYRDIACVVSDYPKSSFESEVREEVTRKLFSHQIIIEKIMNSHSIIPIKFGTLLESRDEVKNFLEKGYFEFKKKLKNLDRKIELEVVAVWIDLNTIVRKIAVEDEGIRNFKEGMAKKHSQDNLQERIRIGSMIKAALDKKREEWQNEMLESLLNKVKVDEIRKHEFMNDSMILNCAFLLDKDKECEFDQALNELNKSFNESIKFRCIGPLPLYSFATYEVKKANFSEIDKARKLLGLDLEFNASDVKSAYRELARQRHPDRFPHDLKAQKKFEEIQAAYELLLNYCGNEKKSIKEEEVKETFMINIFDAKKLRWA